MIEICIKDGSTERDKKLVQKIFQHYLEEKLVDVTFECSQYQLVKAHRLVLSSVSTYFNDLFRCYNDEVRHILLYDTTAEVVRDLLELLYKGNVTVKKESLPKILELIKSFRIEGVTENELLNDGQLDNPDVSSNHMERGELNQSLNAVSHNAGNEEYTEECAPSELSIEEHNSPKVSSINLDETNCELPDIDMNSDSDATEHLDYSECLTTEQNRNNSEKFDNSTLDLPTQLNSSINNTSQLLGASLVLIEEDIPLVVLNDSDDREDDLSPDFLEETKFRSGNKRTVAFPRYIPKKLTKYKKLKSRKLKKNSNGSLDNVFNASNTVDELLKKSLFLMKE